MKDIIAIIGASGFIGQYLCQQLKGAGYDIFGLSRDPYSVKYSRPFAVPLHIWNPIKLDGWEQVLKDVRVVINLAGENVGSGRWTKRRKKGILNSRIHSIETLTRAFDSLGRYPVLFIQASAVGYYGNRGDEIQKEDSSSGNGFLAHVIRQVEDSLEKLKGSCSRLIILRLGMVLGEGGGILPRLLLPFKLFTGGPIGSGKQWISWIHIADVFKAIDFLISHKSLGGTFNLTAPQPVTNKEMSKVLGDLINRPSSVKLPGWMLRGFMGERAQELLLASQRVVPRKLLDAGYSFKYPDIRTALKSLVH